MKKRMYGETKLSDGNIIKYARLRSGTRYQQQTSDQVVRLFQKLQNSGTEVSDLPGDTQTASCHDSLMSLAALDVQKH